MLDSIFKGSCIEEDPPSLGDTLPHQKTPPDLLRGVVGEMTAEPGVPTASPPAPSQSVAAGAALYPHCATWGSSLKIDGISCPGGEKKKITSPAEPVPSPCTLLGMLTASASQPASLAPALAPALGSSAPRVGTGDLLAPSWKPSAPGLLRPLQHCCPPQQGDTGRSICPASRQTE